MSLMTPQRIADLAELTGGWWRTYARKWETKDRIVLYGEGRQILTRAVCAWAGVPLDEHEVDRRTSDLTALFDYAGSIGPKHWRSRLARQRVESWIGGIVEQIRAGRLTLWIPAKANTDSRGNANSIPGRRRTVLGA